MVILGTLEFPASRVILDIQEYRGTLGFLDSRASLGFRGIREYLGFQDTLEFQVSPESQDSLVLVDILAYLVIPDSLDIQEYQGFQVTREITHEAVDILDTLAILVPLGTLE